MCRNTEIEFHFPERFGGRVSIGDVGDMKLSSLRTSEEEGGLQNVQTNKQAVRLKFL